MNTFLKTLALLLAAGLPAVFTAESLGVALPSLLNTADVFGAFVVSLMLLTMSTDYRAVKPLPVLATASRSRLPLAA